MKVREFILELQALDQEAEVVMSSDSEGNSHSPYAEFSEGYYVAASTWSGDWLTDEDFKDDPELDEDLKKEKAVCLYPVN